MKPQLLISFSGGETSAFMTKWLLENKRDDYEMIVVFANVGKEREETLEFVERCDKEFSFNVVWVEAVINPKHRAGTRSKVVDFYSASRNGEPFEAMIKKYGIPNQSFPHCSRELKRNAIRAYAKSIGWRKYYTAIGIRSDEVDRISGNFKEERLLYPLIEMRPTNKPEINAWWIEQPFRLNIKSYEGNCNKCWKKSLRKLLTIEKEERQNSERDAWWEEMEAKYGDYIPESRKQHPFWPPQKTPITFYREHRSSVQIEAMSHTHFTSAKDERFITDDFRQMNLDELLDLSGGCIESCEAF